MTNYAKYSKALMHLLPMVQQQAQTLLQEVDSPEWAVLDKELTTP